MRRKKNNAKASMTDNNKLPLTCADLTEALLAQLREATPQVFTEGRVDFDHIINAAEI